MLWTVGLAGRGETTRDPGRKQGGSNEDVSHAHGANNEAHNQAARALNGHQNQQHPPHEQYQAQEERKLCFPVILLLVACAHNILLSEVYSTV